MTKPDKQIPELLPCPFCGGEAEVLIEMYEECAPHLQDKNYLVSCTCCLAEQKPRMTEDSAIKAWNNRCTSNNNSVIDRLREEVEKLERSKYQRIMDYPYNQAIFDVLTKLDEVVK